MIRWIAFGLVIFAIWLASLHTTEKGSPELVRAHSVLPTPITAGFEMVSNSRLAPPPELKNKNLFLIASDLKQPQDDRFEAVSRMISETSARADLEVMAALPLPDSLGPQALEFEKVLRAYAIESLTLLTDGKSPVQFLKALRSRTRDSFLIQRIQVALASLVDGESVAQKDQKALRNLLQAARH